jgi:signal peptidase I
LIKTFKTALVEYLEALFTSIIVLILIYVFVAFPVTVQGISMQPTLHTGDRLLVETITPRIWGYERGEIVVVSANNSGVSGMLSELLVKRVVGIPGDRVKIFNCKVYFYNDSQMYQLNEDLYLPEGVCTLGGRRIEDGRPYTIPQGEYMVLGDNRENSTDSRNIGFIKKENIQGKVVILFYPTDKIKLY